VKGDPAFELRAAFASAQSAVKLLEQAPDDKPADPALRAQALAALERFEALASEGDPKRFGDAPVADLRGQAALMHAYLVALATPPDYARAVALLDGFEEKYPKIAAQEAPQVVKLRLAAYARLGNLPALAREAERPAVAELEPALLDDVTTRIITTAAREQASGNEEAATAGRRAARLLAERALASPGAASLPAPTTRRLQATLASLYEQQGEPEKALALYRAVLARDPDSVSARAGAARILEAQGKVADARALWDEVVAAPQGKSGWLEAHYQSARLSVALGDAPRACTVLKEVPQSMLVGSNAETPRKIQDLLRSSCRPS
jgi:tetratricopeptide (TPR) repeat protein